MEDLILYQGDDFTLSATVKSGLDAADCPDYTAYLIAKKDTTGINSVLDMSTNSWDSSTALFTGTPTDSSIEGGTYQLEFYVSSSENTFTVGQGKLKVRDTYR